MPKTIKLMPDYGCSPLWAAGGDVGNIELEELPLPEELRAALRAWATAYDGILNQEYPRDSAFPSPAAEDAFEAEGRRLWRVLQLELAPGVKVVYFSQRDRKTLE